MTTPNGLHLPRPDPAPDQPPTPRGWALFAQGDGTPIALRSAAVVAAINPGAQAVGMVALIVAGLPAPLAVKGNVRGAMAALYEADNRPEWEGAK